jgi:hypothetical protein
LASILPAVPGRGNPYRVPAHQDLPSIQKALHFVACTYFIIIFDNKIWDNIIIEF